MPEASAAQAELYLSQEFFPSRSEPLDCCTWYRDKFCLATSRCGRMGISAEKSDGTLGVLTLRFLV